MRKHEQLAADIVKLVGGKENVISLAHCITRLRFKVEDSSLVDEAALKKLGAKGVVCKGQAVQVVLGTQAEHIADAMKKACR